MAGFLSKLKARPDAVLNDAPLPTEFRDPDDPRVLYRLSSRARRISLKAKVCDREVHVVVPNMRAMDKAKKFARANRDWIDVQLEALPAPMPFTPGGTILIRGLDYSLHNPDGRGRPRINHQTREVYVPSPDAESFAGRVRRLLIREARAELEAATHHYAGKLEKKIGKVSIRDQSSRWGSCITRKGEGHISYSWRLISAPPFVLEYVAAHECAHLIEANHSAAFWEIVDEIGDEVKPAKKWLNKNGALLHAVGAEF
ncbi:MAG: M48 family metallopeptidase [Maricaulaceae bacterium]